MIMTNTPELRNTLDIGNFALAYGNENIFTIGKFATIPQVGTTEEDVWDAGGNLVYLNSAEQLDLVSDDANDVNLGTGAWVVQILGLDADFNLASEFIALNGLTPVQTVNSYTRIYRMLVVRSGAPEGALGDIILSDSFANTQAQIIVNNNITRMSHFTVPTGFVGFITNNYTSGGPGDDYFARIKTLSSEPNSTLITNTDIEITNSGIFSENYSPPLGPVSERTNIKVVAATFVGNANVRASYNITCVREEFLQRYVSQMV